MKSPVVIVWFRQDLRLSDNPALSHAASIGKIVPVYIFDDKHPQVGSAQKWWLHRSLTDLKKNLAKHKVDLILRRGDPEAILKDLISQTGAQHLTWNRCYDPHSISRDTKLKQLFIDQDIEVESFNGSLLIEPESIKNKSGSHFKVFTPYWKECLRRMAPVNILKIPFLSPAQISLKSDDLDDWNLLPTKPNWASKFHKYWQPGEKGAHKTLALFIDNAISRYATNRNIPSKNGTSQLSPYLHFGEISIDYVWQQIEKLSSKDYGTDVHKYLTELGWREFSYYLLYHRSDIITQPFNVKFTNFPWQSSDSLLKAWQTGKTGYPIIDAGMRQLYKTGWMHNRVRMITASFLTKHLLINWQIGAEWFLDTLFDADIASNTTGWQWVAGCGADAAPYFRIFSPILQGQKFDPRGEYVRQYVPEIANLPDKFIHTPWLASADILKQCKVTLDKDYPRPIVDHSEARKGALTAYRSLKSKEEEF